MTTCRDFKPDHNGECVNCDGWAEDHVTNWVCPRCKSRKVNNVSFDFYNFCIDCGYEWRSV